MRNLADRIRAIPYYMRYAYGTGFFWFFVKCGDKVFCAVWSFIKKLKLVVDRLDIREYNSIINTLNI